MAKDVFITEDFLLQTEAARRLYHEYAEGLPIIDYHCHLPPDQIARDHRFANLTQVWLAGDHYKWRAMRTNGVDERYCTGDASDYEKFCKWAETMPRCLRNPLYHWTHLELKRYFGISDRLLSPATAQSIWDECNAKLAQPEFSCRGLIRQSNVALICTTDDPVDTLEHHQAIARDKSFDIPVLPAWRPDKATAIADVAEFNAYVDKLAAAADVEINTFDALLAALRKRHAYFHDNGCRVSDHGLETIRAEDFTEKEVSATFAKARAGKPVSPAEAYAFELAMLYHFGIMDHEKGWTQQFHIGALRNNNSRMFARAGRDIGFDSIGDFEVARPLSRLLDRLDRTNRLARTILYNLNPRDNALMATMIGNFQDGSIPGKIQYGSAWWFLDQKDGMEAQIEALSQMSLLSRFVGMLTDSRSFLSYTRHEYFRRILCNVLGNDMTAGLIPDDYELVGGMVRDICYYNAADYFGFEVKKKL
ncbi:MAG TPA: glucuronate isomerase [Phycisphaerae bacterium]|nr:glucuronate isomerase [Phycisphaerae bacterium]HON65786.1 glucuronate isomerase [Phycisphaerae bacterium]HPP26905.1 glucuronate isomerase [Phycisphaerae bacterium]